MLIWEDQKGPTCRYCECEQVKHPPLVPWLEIAVATAFSVVASGLPRLWAWAITNLRWR